MRRIVVLVCLIAVVGCGSGQDQEAPEAEMQEAAMPVAAPLADFAGTWAMRAMTEEGDSILIEYEMTATSDTEGWTVTFPDRDPIPAQIMEAQGDSVVIYLGPYPSALREDMSVSTVTVSRIVDGRMVGYFTATYETDREDSVLRGRQVGERVH
jgi:hypothetical protein